MLFKEEQYEEALALFQAAAKDNPKDALTNLWLGLALEANKQPYAAMEAWRTCYGNAKWEPVADYLKAMSWWRMGYTNDAIAYFKDALINVRDGKAISFKPAQEAIQQINEGASTPHFSTWPDISTLVALSKQSNQTQAAATTTPQPAKAQANTSTKNPKKAVPETASTTTTPKPNPASAIPVKAGATPKAGKWIATVSNGYKGDVLTFRVAADGKSIVDVEFKGHWRDRGYGIEVLTNLDPPSPYKVAKGNFSAVQQDTKAGMWWEFTGTFLTATTAQGSYRATFAGGENDTYKLKWTAKRVSP